MASNIRIAAALLALMTGVAHAATPSWNVPHTPWGDPDLRGTWPLDSVGQTPLERRPELGDRALLTDAEYQAALDRAAKTAQGADREEKSNTLGSGSWFEWGKPLRQTSLIVEPANGRIPPLTAEGETRSKAMKSSWSQKTFEDLSDFNSLDRCITRGLPASMIPFPYNNGVRIFQSPGYVVLQLEIVHETRIIPIDAPAPAKGVQTWLGASRGHWEGNTLVIDTRNFTGIPPMNIVGPGNKPIPTSDALHLVERLTPTGPNTIDYEATIEDPIVLTHSWKMAFPWTRNDKYQLFEYACHEGNTTIRNYIKSTSPRYVGEITNPSDPAKWVADTVKR